MKKKLTKIKTSTYYFVNGEKREDVPSGIRGDLSGVRGDLSGVRGDLSNVRGDLDACEITAAERAAGVNVSDLLV